MKNESTQAVGAPLERRVRLHRPRHCPCLNESPDPCPACGATVGGNDSVRGVCQATHRHAPSDYGLRLIVVDRDTGLCV